jgi:hypothetical protein
VGGNALKTTVKERINRDRYLKIQEKVLGALKETQRYISVYSPFALPEKETFGDLDVHCLVESNHPSNPSLLDPKEFFTNHASLQSKEVLVMNPKSLSFECDGFQVDVKVYEDPVEFENDNILMSCGGLGSMLGFALKVVGLKWNQRGLFLTLPIVPDESQTDAFLICRNSRDILKFLGLADFDLIARQTRDEQIFAILASSISILSYDRVQEQMKYIAGKQSMLRPSVHRFLQYITTSIHPKSIVFNEKEFQQKILDDYPELAREVEEARVRVKRKLIIKEKFKGALVGDIVGLEKKPLGDFMKRYKMEVGEDFIIASSQETIKASIKDFFQQTFQ